MSTDVLMVDAGSTVSDAARRMREADAIAALVPLEKGDALFTVSDALGLAAEGVDAGEAKVGEWCAVDVVHAQPDWDLKVAARQMVEGPFRHLPVREGGETAGLLSIRDVIGCFLVEHERAREMIEIRSVMHREVPVLAPDATLGEAVRVMKKQSLGAVVVEPHKSGRPPSLATERDALYALAGGENPDRTRVGDVLGSGTTFSAPDWSLLQAADAMIKGGFQHVIVVERDRVEGIISMRDVLTHWTE